MNVKTATRILDVFETFASEARPLSLSELGRLLEIPVSSCFGLVQTLQNRGYIYEAQRRSGYYPTKRLLTVAEKIAANDPLLDRVEQILTRLRDDTGETVVFGKLQDDKVLYLDVIDSRQSIRYAGAIGEFRSLHANSLGKAILGSMESDERKQLLDGYVWSRLTEHTLTTPKALEADLAVSRQRGWYLNLSESVLDLAAVACPIKVNKEWYAVSAVGPLYRIEPALAEHAKRVCAACAEIENMK